MYDNNKNLERTQNNEALKSFLRGFY